MNNLKIIIIDEDNKHSEILSNKSSLTKNSPYFLSMLNNFAESKINEITIRAPDASVTRDIIESFDSIENKEIDLSTDAIYCLSWIQCADFMCVDYNHILKNIIIPSEYFDTFVNMMETFIGITDNAVLAFVQNLPEGFNEAKNETIMQIRNKCHSMLEKLELYLLVREPMPELSNSFVLLCWGFSCVSHDNQLFVTTEKTTIAIISLPTSRRECPPLGHPKMITRIIDIGKLLSNINYITDVCFSSDDKFLFICDDFTQVWCFDMLILMNQNETELMTYFPKLTSIWNSDQQLFSISIHNNTLISAEADGIMLWNTVTGVFLKNINDHSAYDTVISPNGKIMASLHSEDDDIIKIWKWDNIFSINKIREIIIYCRGGDDLFDRAMSKMMISSDNQFLVVGVRIKSKNKIVIYVWDIDNGQLVQTIDNAEFITNNLVILEESNLKAYRSINNFLEKY